MNLATNSLEFVYRFEYRLTWMKRVNVLRRRGDVKHGYWHFLSSCLLCFSCWKKKKSQFLWLIINIENIYSDVFFSDLFFSLYCFLFMYVNHRYGTVYDSYQWMLCTIIIVVYSVVSNKFFVIQWLNQINEVNWLIDLFVWSKGFFFIDLELHKSVDLEDTVRNLREENARLLQLLRSRK